MFHLTKEIPTSNAGVQTGSGLEGIIAGLNPINNMKRPSKIRVISTIALAALCLWQSPSTRAIEVGWHDNMYLQPGDGVQLNDQKEPASVGLVLLTNPTTTNNTGSFTESVSFAQHTYDMVKALSVNSSVSLDSLMFSGDVSVSFVGKQTFDANDLIFVYTATKDFGTTVYSPVDFSPTNKALIASFQNKLSGAALDAAITSALGSYYVRGYDSAAIVSVVYTFHYAAASLKQQTIGTANASWDTGSFSGFVSSFFGTSNSAISMSYQFYSTDPYQLATNLFGSTGIITNFQQYTNFVGNVEAYANAMSAAHAKVTGYVLDPIQTVPGYLAILGGYVPPTPNPADYNSFLQAYTALQVTKQNLDTWLLSGNTLSWLNSQGRQTLIAQWNQVANYLAEMKSIAQSHFSTGTPLNVPADAAGFLAGLSAIRFPQIIYMDSFASGSDRCVIGRVDCGCTNLTAPSPFYNVAARYHGTNFYNADLSGNGNKSLVPIYYDASDFQTNMLKLYSSDSTITTHLNSFFAGELWPCLTNSNPDINGYFLITQPSSQAANWALEIDTIDSTGTPVAVDEKTLLDNSTLSDGCTFPCEISTPLNQ